MVLPGEARVKDQAAGGSCALGRPARAAWQQETYQQSPCLLGAVAAITGRRRARPPPSLPLSDSLVAMGTG